MANLQRGIYVDPEVIRLALTDRVATDLNRAANQISQKPIFWLAPTAIAILATALSIASAFIVAIPAGVGVGAGCLAVVIALGLIRRFQSEATQCAALAIEELQKARADLRQRAPLSNDNAVNGRVPSFYYYRYNVPVFDERGVGGFLIADFRLQSVIVAQGATTVSRPSVIARTIEMAVVVMAAVFLPIALPVLSGIAGLFAVIHLIRAALRLSNLTTKIRLIAQGHNPTNEARNLDAIRGHENQLWKDLRCFYAKRETLSSAPSILSKRLGVSTAVAQRLHTQLEYIATHPGVAYRDQVFRELSSSKDALANEMISRFVANPSQGGYEGLILALGLMLDPDNHSIRPETGLLDVLPESRNWSENGYRNLLLYAQIRTPYPEPVQADLNRLINDRALAAAYGDRTHLEGQLADAQRTVQQLAQERNDLQRQLNTAQRQLAQLGRENDANLRGTRENLERRLAELNARYEDLSRNYNEATRHQRELIDQLQRVRAISEEQDITVRNLNQRIAEITHREGRLQADLQAERQRRGAIEIELAQSRDRARLYQDNSIANERAFQDVRRQLADVRRDARVAAVELRDRVRALFEIPEQPLVGTLAQAEAFMNAVNPEWRQESRDNWPVRIRAIVEQEEAAAAAIAAAAAAAAAAAEEERLAAERAEAQRLQEAQEAFAASAAEVKILLGRSADELLNVHPLVLQSLDVVPNLPPATEEEVRAAIEYFLMQLPAWGLDNDQAFARSVQWLTQRNNTPLMGQLIQNFPGVCRALRDAHLLIQEKTAAIQAVEEDPQADRAQADVIRGSVQAGLYQFIQATQQCWGAWEAQMPLMVSILSNQTLGTKDWIESSLLEMRRSMAVRATTEWGNGLSRNQVGGADRLRDINEQPVHVQAELRWRLMQLNTPVSLPGARDAQHDAYFNNRAHWNDGAWRSLTQTVYEEILNQLNPNTVGVKIQEMLNAPDQEIRRLEIQNEIRAATLANAQAPEDWTAEIAQALQQAQDAWVPDEITLDGEIQRLEREMQALEDQIEAARGAQQPTGALRMAHQALVRKLNPLRTQKAHIVGALPQDTTPDQINLIWQQAKILNQVLLDRGWGTVFDHANEAVLAIQNPQDWGNWLTLIASKRLEGVITDWIGGLFPDDRCSFAGAIEVARHLQIILPLD